MSADGFDDFFGMPEPPKPVPAAEPDLRRPAGGRALQAMEDNPAVPRKKPKGFIAYHPDVFQRILDMKLDKWTLREICELDGMPSITNFYRWLEDDLEAAKRYQNVQIICMDMYGEEIIDIAEDGTNDWMERRNRKGEVIGYAVNKEALERSRIRISARQYLMEKLSREKFGQHTTVKVDNPMDNLSPAEIKARIARLSTDLADREKLSKQAADLAAQHAIQVAQEAARITAKPSDEDL